MNKAWLLLLLLVPLCTAQKYQIECFGEDFLLVRGQLLQCRSEERQVCYTRENGDKGCTTLKHCGKPGWKCCDTNRCNA